MKRIVLILSLLVLNGCSTYMKHNYVPSAVKADWPEIEKETTVFVGDRMLIQGYTAKSPVLSIDKFVDGACFDIPTGEYPIVGKDAEKQYFSFKGSSGAVERASMCDQPAGIAVFDNNQKEACVVTMFGSIVCYAADYSIKSVETTHASNKQSSLLYSGRDGDQIKFTYVSIQGGTPIFAHNVSYNIKESDVIGYRGARIKIHNSSNEQVTYTVLQTFTERQ